VDGASEFLIFRKIVLPLLRPILVTLALQLLGTWNDFLWPLIVLSDERQVHATGGAGEPGREHVQDTELMMAGAVVTVIPCWRCSSCSSAPISAAS